MTGIPFVFQRLKWSDSNRNCPAEQIAKLHNGDKTGVAGNVESLGRRLQEFRRGIKDYTPEIELRQRHCRHKIKMIVRVLGRVIEIGNMDERDFQTTPFDVGASAIAFS